MGEMEMRNHRNDVLRTAATALALCVCLASGGATAAEDNRIGIVDIEQAITATEEGKAARDELERKVRDAESQLQPMVDQLKAMFEEVEAKQFVLSEDAMRQKQLEVAELRNKIENRKREVEGQLQVDRERLIGPLREKLNTIILDIGRKEGFALILQRGTPGVMYTREALDITDKVIQAFNQG
jgi:outer membrane protein